MLMAQRNKGAKAMNISDKIKHDAAMAAWDYIGKNPEANIPKVLDKV